jgi:phage terminase small subunit
MSLPSIARLPIATKPKPPRGLSRAARDLWTSLQQTYAITDPGGLLLLELAAKSFDDWTAARKLLEAEGLTMVGRQGSRKVHPPARIVETSHRAMMSSLRALHLDVEPLKAIGRPPGK